MANIVVVSLLHFIKERLIARQYEYLNYSWKKIADIYLKEWSGWQINEGYWSIYSILINNLSDESGNIADIEALMIGIRASNKTIKKADYKELCEIISKLFQERMNVLQRQIFANRNGNRE